MSGSARFVLVLAILGSLAGAAAFLRCEGTPPRIEVDSPIYLRRGAVPVEVTLSDPGSGLRALRVTLVHAGGEIPLVDHRFEGSLLRGGASGRAPERFRFEVDAGALGLPEGEARAIFLARDHSWRDFLRGNRAQREVPVVVDRRPPRISVENGLTYVRRGGAAAVAFSVDEPTRTDGVEVGETLFRAWPWPPVTGPREAGDVTAGEEAAARADPGAAPRPPGRRVALFAIPRDASPEAPVAVVAEDRAGNRASARWPVRIRNRQFRTDVIRLPRSFLTGVVPPLAEAHDIDTSDPVAAFQKINTELRAANEARIREIVADSAPEPLFRGAFLQMPGSAVTSRFAEERIYLVDGRRVSRATHFGYDLAATAAAPVPAANRGRVLFAGDLGIYGQCVILDHGLGLSSLYGHLSRIDVKPGELVEKGATLGLSGSTGLAGGDHLHFAILVGGVYVDPVEWWDPKWVREHVERRIEPEADGAPATG